MDSFDRLKQNWRSTLVGTQEDIQVCDAEMVRSRLDACAAKAEEAWNLLRARKREDAPALFRDEPLQTSADMTAEYRSLHAAALGYATPGNRLYGCDALLQDILWALDWMYRHYYGVAEMEDRGWRSVRLSNWWDWQIGTPVNLQDTMLLVDEHLTPQQKRDYLALFDMLVKRPRDYGANKVDFGMLIARSGILQENAERILCGRDEIADTYLMADRNVNDGQGFYSDGSYVFHTRHAMVGTYGRAHFKGLIQFTRLLEGSEFAMSRERVDVLYHWLYKTFLPFLRDGGYMVSVLGRHPEGSLGTALGIMANIVHLYDLSAPGRQRELAALMKRLVMEHPQFAGGEFADFRNMLSLHDYAVYTRMISCDAEPAPRLTGCFAYNQMDRMVQHNEASAFSLSMSSSRIYNYECINHQNMTGWYLGDGMLNCLTDPHQYDAAYWESVDRYRLPGTTVDFRPRKAATIAQANEYLSGQDFVGGLSAGSIGMAAMQLESYHSDGRIISTRFCSPGSDDYGGAPPAHDSTLMAKKAWFFLNGCAVCLGADIHSRDNCPVYTIVENRKDSYTFRNGEIAEILPDNVYINGKACDIPGEDTLYSGVRHFTIGPVACCLFAPQDLILRRRTGETSFTEALWPHGENPANGSYAYVLLPHADARAAEAFCASPGVKLLSNTPQVQMVRDAASGTLCGVFWQAGSCGGISVSAPVLVCAEKDRLSVCDVTRRLKAVTVCWAGKEYFFDLSDADGASRSVDL